MRIPTVIGRDAEMAVAKAACDRASRGHGSVLIVLGEPGIGKTALLEAIGDTPGWRVVRATGVKSETEVTFATLQGLLWPLRAGLEQLDSGQARLLRALLDLGPVEGATTFAVGAAALALFSVSSQEQPLMVVIDDAQWADVASQQVLAFVGRRLSAERVAMFAGVRDLESSLLAEERSFQQVVLGGLPSEEARTLLESAVSDGLAVGVVEALLGVCAGNPLGLLELPRGLTQAQRRGVEPLPDLIDVGPSVQNAFAARAASLDAGASRALLVLAAAGEADPSLLERIGLPLEAVDAIKASGLVEQRAGNLVFKHPLMQAAVYSAAPADERRAAHRDLAVAVDGVRRPWHLAAAASGPDENAAQALVAIAAEVRLAGGLAEEAHALERAAELTPDRELKARRMLASSQAWRRAGRLKHGFDLAQRALPLAISVRTRAELQLERGSFLVRNDEPEPARSLLMAEAERAAPTEPKLAAQMMVRAAFPPGEGLTSTVAVAYRALELAGHDGDQAELEALNAVIEHRTETGLPPDDEDLALVQRAAELLERAELRAGSDELHWIAYCLALFEFDDQARHFSDLGLTETRASGDVWNLCYALYARAAIEQVTGRLDAARPFAIEGLALAEELGETFRFNEACAIMAEVEWGRGAAEEALRAHDARRATRDPMQPFYKANLRGSLGIASGDFAVAIANFETALPFLHAGAARAWYLLVPLELAEAYLGVGRKKEAEAQLLRVGQEIERSPLRRPKAKLARVRALAAPEGRYDSWFVETLALLEATPQAHDRARTELSWAERLGRSKRTAEAAVHFERALVHFEALGAVGWAERVRRGLEGLTGQARVTQPRRTDVLSAQELRIAQHAAAGMRDREIAAVLYLSPRTVESHLQSAYRKLDVVNRTQLAAVMAGDGIGTQSPVIPR